MLRVAGQQPSHAAAFSLQRPSRIVLPGLFRDHLFELRLKTITQYKTAAGGVEHQRKKGFIIHKQGVFLLFSIPNQNLKNQGHSKVMSRKNNENEHQIQFRKLASRTNFTLGFLRPILYVTLNP